MDRAIILYTSLRADLGTSELRALKREVSAHHERLVKAQERAELIAIDLSAAVAGRLASLLDVAEQLGPEERASVVGAARYYVSHDDAVPDHELCTGLDDDVHVFNHVASALGRADLIIDG